MPIKMAIVVLTCNAIDRTKAFWANLINVTTGRLGSNIGLVVVDNGSTDETVSFLKQYIFNPHFPHHVLVQNSENKGVFTGCNQGWKAMDAELYAFLHNDLYINAHDWNTTVTELFDRIPWVGLLGFGGAKLAGPTGERGHFASNMLEAEHHGTRLVGFSATALLDGMIMVARKQMLEQVGGFDESYPIHHYYDKDISMASTHGGWVNVVVGVPCHHMSGQTAIYLPEVNALHDEARAHYVKKWGKHLPWSSE